MAKRQRLIRVLVYEGSPSWIEDFIKRRWVKGSITLAGGIIREAVLGDFLETFDSPPKKVKENDNG